MDAFRAKVEEYCGHALQPARPVDVHATADHIGWEPQGDGRWCYGLNIENGRIADTTRMRLKSALRQICQQLSPGLRLTAHQSMLLTDLPEHDRPRLEAILREHQVPLSEEISTVRRWSMACVAWPTCGLAITESERALPGVIDAMEAELQELGLSARGVYGPHDRLPERLCAAVQRRHRPGRQGAAAATRCIWAAAAWERAEFPLPGPGAAGGLVPLLVPLFAYFRQDRTAGESFGDFCHRKGRDDLLAWATPSTALGMTDSQRLQPAVSDVYHARLRVFSRVWPGVQHR